MEEVTLRVTVQVDSDGRLDKAHSAVAALNAVRNALDQAAQNGFDHPFEASVGIVEVEITDR